MAKYFLIAGEASGDMHAASLITALRERDADASFAGLGGDRMQAAGCRMYQHYNRMAYMGYIAVIAHAGDIRRNIHITRQALLDEQPDELILVDYPGFNLRMAAFCRRHLPQTRITYYIPPKVWAWKRRRVHKIGRYCHRILGIFPFEPAFYARYGVKCTYVGNPTAETITGNVKTESTDHTSPVIALLPGSRRNEIEKCLPKMLMAAEQAIQATPDIQRIVVTQAPGIESGLYERICSGHKLTELTTDTYTAVRQARAAVVNSGTATLETALLGCPQVSVYHLAMGHILKLFNPLRPLIFQTVYFTLVNIITGREVIRELMAYDFTVEAVRDELQRMLTDRDYVARMQEGYMDVKRILGTMPASATAAAIITDDMNR